MPSVLVTGSRRWTDRAAIATTLRALPGWPVGWTLIEGEAEGADKLARSVAEEDGAAVEPYPADWVRYLERAGLIRNAAMVVSGADVCWGFPLPDSTGTLDCMQRATEAGIVVHVYGEGEGL